MKWSDHPVAHLRKVAIAYKKELAIGAVGKMSKSDLIALLDKHLTLGEDGKISIKGKYTPKKDLDVILEEPKEKEKAKPKMKKEKESTEKESKVYEEKEGHKVMEKEEKQEEKPIIKDPSKLSLDEIKEHLKYYNIKHSPNRKLFTLIQLYKDKLLPYKNDSKKLNEMKEMK